MRKLLILVTATLLFVSCGNINEISEDSVSKEVHEYAQNYLNRLWSGDIDYCYNQLSKQYQDKDSRKFLQETYTKLKDKKLVNSTIVKYTWLKRPFNDSGASYGINYEYEYNDTWVYYSFNLQEKNGKISILGLNISPFDDSLRAVHAFTLENKEVTHYIFLFWMILVPVFILLSAVFVFKTPLRRRWLWLIFVLFGFVSIYLNWSTGEVGFQFLSFRLLGASFVKQGVVAPWIFSFSIPLGAVLFWFKRAEILKKQEEVEPIELKEK